MACIYKIKGKGVSAIEKAEYDQGIRDENGNSFSPSNEKSSRLNKNLKNFEEGFKNEVIRFMMNELVNISGALVSHEGETIVKKKALKEHVYAIISNNMSIADDKNQESVGDNLYSIVEGTYENDNNKIVYGDAFNSFFDIAVSELKQYGLNMEKQSLDNIERNEKNNIKEEDISGNLGIDDQLTMSKKNSARESTKLMVEFLKNPYMDSSYFGSYLNTGGKYGENWMLLGDALQGTVDSSTELASEIMLKKIEKLSETHGQFKHLANLLNSDQVADHVKTKFYSDFSFYSVNFKGSQVYKDYKNDVTKIEYSHGNNRGAVALLTNGNIAKFETDHVKNDKVNPKLNEAVELFKETLAEVQDKRKVTSVKDSFNYLNNVLPSIFKSIGVTVSSEALTDYANTVDGVDSLIGDELQHLFVKSSSKSNQSLSEMIKGSWDIENNLFKNSSFAKLMGFQAKYEGLPGDRTIYGPDGKMMFTESLNSSMSKTMQRFKNGEMFNELLNTTYHRSSKCLKEIKNQYDNGNSVADFSVFLYHKEITEEGDNGTDNVGLQLVDDYFDRFNKAMEGSLNRSRDGSEFTVLTMADKSRSYSLNGFKFERFEIINDRAVDYFYDYAKAEMERIQYSIANPGKVDFYDTKGGALKSYWFPDLSKGGKLDLELDLYNSTFKENEQAVKNYIKESLLKRISKETEFFSKYGLKDINPKVKDKYGVTVVNSDNLQRMVTDYALNSIKMNIEFTMMFTGDPAHYKDLGKRVPSTSATGLDLIAIRLANGEMSIPEKFYATVSNDIEVKSKLYDQYAEYFRDNDLDVNVLAPYNKDENNDGVNVADAQAYITPKRFRDIARGLGKWEKRHDKMYNMLIGKEKVEPKVWNDLQELMQEMGVPAGQPQKGMQQELVIGENKTTPVFFKYSQAVLWPSVIKGTGLENLAKAMGDKVDEHIFKSGVKVGATDVRDIDFDNVELGEPMELSNFYWKLQQDLPAKYAKKGEALVGSQPKKNILANVKNRMIGDRTGEEVANDIHAIEGALSDLGLSELSDLWDIRNGVVNDSNGSMRNNIIDKFREDGVSNNVIGALEDGAPLDSIFQFTEKIESELHSKITKATVKLTSPGGAFIQMSNAGFTKPKGMDKSEMGDPDLNGIIYLKPNEELLGPRKVDGKTVPGDVFLPFNALNKIPNLKELIAKKDNAAIVKALGDTHKRLVGYRIPNQGMSSIDLLNIAGILPPNMGDTIVVYTEVTAKTGSDFDIDKMYVMMRNAEYNYDSKQLESIPYLDDSNSNSTIRRNYKYYNEILKNLDNSDISKIISHNKENQKVWEGILKMIDNRWEETKEEYGYYNANDEEYKELLEKKDEIKENFYNSEQKEFIKTESFRDAIDASVESGAIPSISEFEKLSIPNQNSKKALQNQRINLWAEILEADATYGDLVTPLDSEDLKEYAYYVAFLEEMRKNPESVVKVSDKEIEEINNLSRLEKIKIANKYFKEKPLEALEFASPTYQLEIKSRNMAGKAGIGQTANHLTNHALAQLAYWNLEYKLGIGNMTSDGGVDLSGVFVDEEIEIVPSSTESSEVKKDVSEVFQEAPELASIGTERQYSEYLDSVFPDSKVKDIVYHGSPYSFTEFSKKELGKTTGAASAKEAFFFSDSYYNMRHYSTWKAIQDSKSLSNDLSNMSSAVRHKDNKSYQEAKKSISLLAPHIVKEIDRLKTNKTEVIAYIEEQAKQHRELEKKYKSFENSTAYVDTLRSYLAEGYNENTSITKGFETLASVNVDGEVIMFTDDEEVFRKPYNEMTSQDFKELDKRTKSAIDFYEKESKDLDKGYVYHVLLNSENPMVKSDKGNDYREETYFDRLREAQEKGNDSLIIEETKDPNLSTIYTVPETNQIHILGSKKDIQGFKDFVGKPQSSEVTNPNRKVGSNKGKKTITAVISAYLNAYVDNAKDPYISLINNNTKTANVVFLMLRAGVNPDYVNAFVSQPAIKKYVETQFYMDSKSYVPIYVTHLTTVIKNGVISKEENKMGTPLNIAYEAGIKGRLSTKELQDLSEVNLEELESNILEGGSDNQVALLNKFIEIYHEADKLNDAVKSTKADTEGTFGNNAGQFAHTELVRKVEENDYVNNYSKIYEGFLGNMDKNSQKGAGALASLFLSTSNFAKQAAVRISEMTGNGSYAVNKDLNNKVFKALRTYVYADHPMLQVSKKEKDRILNTVPEALMRLKDKYPSNLLFKALNVPKIEGKLRIGAGSKAMGSEIDGIWGTWEDLLNGDKKERKFANDLIKYSFISSGFTSGLSSFHDYVPASYMKKQGFYKLIYDKLEEFQMGMMSDDFITKFLIHSAADSKVVPKVSKNHVKAGFIAELGTYKGNKYAKAINISTAPSKLTYTTKDDDGEDVTNMKQIFLFSTKSNNEKLEVVYKFKEFDEGRAIYVPTETLSTYNKGYRSNSYSQTDIALNSSFSEIGKDLGDLVVDDVNKILKYDNLDVDFKLTKNSNEFDYSLDMMINKDQETYKKHIDNFDGTFENVIIESDKLIKRMGYDKIVSTINNCH